MKRSPHGAFQLFIDERMRRTVQKYAGDHGKDNDNFGSTLAELEAFRGFQSREGMSVGKNTPAK